MSQDNDEQPEAMPMYVRFPAELHALVKQRAKADDRTMAQTIRYALRYYLAHTEPLPHRTPNGD